jgi:hypothetical protein
MTLPLVNFAEVRIAPEINILQEQEVFRPDDPN